MRSAVDDEYDDELLSADTDRVVILGEAMLYGLLDEHPENELSKYVLGFMDVYLDDPHERALFNLSPRLDYDDKVVPFKPPRDEFGA
jgi:hypothetical protein